MRACVRACVLCTSCVFCVCVRRRGRGRVKRALWDWPPANARRTQAHHAQVRQRQRQPERKSEGGARERGGGLTVHFEIRGPRSAGAEGGQRAGEEGQGFPDRGGPAKVVALQPHVRGHAAPLHVVHGLPAAAFSRRRLRQSRAAVHLGACVLVRTNRPVRPGSGRPNHLLGESERAAAAAHVSSGQPAQELCASRGGAVTALSQFGRYTVHTAGARLHAAEGVEEAAAREDLKSALTRRRDVAIRR